MWWIIVLAVYIVGLIIVSVIVATKERTMIDFILILSWPIILTAYIVSIVAKTLYLCYDAIVCGIENEINNLG